MHRLVHRDHRPRCLCNRKSHHEILPQWKLSNNQIAFRSKVRVPGPVPRGTNAFRAPKIQHRVHSYSTRRTVAITGIAQCGIHWQLRHGDLRFMAWLPDRSNGWDDRCGSVSIASIHRAIDVRSDVAHDGVFDRKVGRMTEVNRDSRGVRVPVATLVEELTSQRIRLQGCTDLRRPKPILQPAGCCAATGSEFALIGVKA